MKEDKDNADNKDEKEEEGDASANDSGKKEREEHIIDPEKDFEELEPPRSKLHLQTGEEDLPEIKPEANTLQILDRFLKEPSAIFNSISMRKCLGSIFGSAFIFSSLFFLAYGLAMGFFSGWHAGMFSAAKLPIIFLGAYIITLPSFYVFGSLSGARFTASQAAVMLFTNMAGSALILIGFAPVVWFFAVSTDGKTFIIIMHFVIIAIAVFFGLVYMWRAHAFFCRKCGDFTGSSSLLGIWTLLYMFVLCQMLNFMRPLIVDGPSFINEKQLFFEGFVRLF